MTGVHRTHFHLQGGVDAVRAQVQLPSIMESQRAGGVILTHAAHLVLLLSVQLFQEMSFSLLINFFKTEKDILSPHHFPSKLKSSVPAGARKLKGRIIYLD